MPLHLLTCFTWFWCCMKVILQTFQLLFMPIFHLHWSFCILCIHVHWLLVVFFNLIFQPSLKLGLRWFFTAHHCLDIGVDLHTCRHCAVSRRVLLWHRWCRYQSSFLFFFFLRLQAWDFFFVTIFISWVYVREPRGVRRCKTRLPCSLSTASGRK